MMDLTWLGWIFVIDMSLSVVIHLFRGISGSYVRSGAESLGVALVTVLYLVGFFLVGFTN
jgi:hypothetical protein